MGRPLEVNLTAFPQPSLAAANESLLRRRAALPDDDRLDPQKPCESSTSAPAACSASATLVRPAAAGRRPATRGAPSPRRGTASATGSGSSDRFWIRASLNRTRTAEARGGLGRAPPAALERPAPSQAPMIASEGVPRPGSVDRHDQRRQGTRGPWPSTLFAQRKRGYGDDHARPKPTWRSGSPRGPGRPRRGPPPPSRRPASRAAPTDGARGQRHDDAGRQAAERRPRVELECSIRLQEQDAPRTRTAAPVSSALRSGLVTYRIPASASPPLAGGGRSPRSRVDLIGGLVGDDHRPSWMSAFRSRRGRWCRGLS